MKGFLQSTVLLLVLLLPSTAVCALCTPDWCPMAMEPEPLEAAASPDCHQRMADDGAGNRAAATASLQPDCCTAAAEPEGEAPAVLTPASAGALLTEAARGPETAFGSGAPIASRWAPPPPRQSLYHLHGSLLI